MGENEESPGGRAPLAATPDEPLPHPDPHRATVLVIGVVATVLFVVLRFAVALGGHDPLAVDVWWDELMFTWLSDTGLVIAWVPSIVGGVIGAPVVGILIIGIFLWRRRRWDAATLAVAIVTVTAIGAPMAAIIARVRPSESLAESVDTSFPSGHTAVATTIAVTLGLLLRRWYVWTLGVVWVVYMMWSRTYLHAHWASDVVAGLLEGIAVACLVWSAMQALRIRRQMSTSASSPEPDA
ncbi:phosphatase PAP2 family protein [Microbacterium sp. M3]|uniref:Phosphatase PAP2 family protein n=1 Tax=Microbacterium arthrosphaerae TaxID=792652 RepID=A0ABU4GVU2_9MICO|nr:MULTISPECIES: phosphatase PAP2 family protein [Microbacterium]MDW4571195.1 phosphatase PAP2 family protein [Microbacterium arthrosphaerae]MDW7605050.1 phosphatase PAP2 family protein [Microbacterium sp. M3]